jgi:membrane associated rhomboid family serine protease
MKRMSPPAGTVSVRIGSVFRPAALVLLALFGTTYLLALYPPAGRFIAEYLQLRPGLAIGKGAYQILVAPLLMSSILRLLFVGLILWQLGSAVEQRSGSRRFLGWMASTAVASSLAMALFGALLGRWQPQYALMPVTIDGSFVFLVGLLGFAHYYATTPVRPWGIGQEVSGRGLSWFLIGISLLADLWYRQWVELAGQLAAVGWMSLLLRQPWQGVGRRKPTKKRAPFEVLDGGLSAGGVFGGRLGGGGAGTKEKRWVN